MMESLVLFSILLIAVPASARYGPIQISEDTFAPPNGPPPPPQPIPGPYNQPHFARFFWPRKSILRGPLVDYSHHFRLHHHRQLAGLHKVLLHNEVLATHHVVNGLRKDVLVRLMVFAIPSPHDDKLHPLILQTKLNGFGEIAIPTTIHNHNNNDDNNEHHSPPFVPMTTTTSTTTSTPIQLDLQTQENPVSEEPVRSSELSRNKRSIENPMGGGMGGGMGSGQDIRASFEKFTNKFKQSYQEMEQIFKSTVDKIKKSFMPPGGGGMPSMPGMDSMPGMGSGGMPPMPSAGSMPIPGADSMGKMEVPGIGKK